MSGKMQNKASFIIQMDAIEGAKMMNLSRSQKMLGTAIPHRQKDRFLLKAPLAESVQGDTCSISEFGFKHRFGSFAI